MRKAHRFDPLVEACTARLGNPALDLLAIRRKHLDASRQALAAAGEQPRGCVDLRIAIDGRKAIVAALLLRDARRFAATALPEIIERVSAVATGSRDRLTCCREESTWNLCGRCSICLEI